MTSCAKEVFQRLRYAARLEVGAGREQPEFDRLQPSRNQRLLHRLDVAHRNVGVAAQQIVDRVGCHQFDRECRVSPPQLREDLRHPLHTDRFACAHSNCAGHLVRRGARCPLQRRRGSRQRFRVRQHVPRKVRGNQSPLRTHEQIAANRRLQRLDVAGYRRLRDAEPSRGARQRSFLQHREERSIQLPVGFLIHTFAFSRSTILSNFLVRCHLLT